MNVGIKCEWNGFMWDKFIVWYGVFMYDKLL